MINKETQAYLFLTTLVVCGLTSALITAPKVIFIGINFPFANIVFALLTFPILDCICELWGKQAARQTLFLALFSQIFITIIIQLSIIAPHPSFWQLQPEYSLILGTGVRVVIASLLAISVSQILDLTIYQKLKELTKGKFLWLRSNISTYLGQILDSMIFINIVFYHSNQKLNLMLGSIAVKILLSFLMTPMVYLIVMGVNKYLDSNTLAFKLASDAKL